MKLIVVLSIIAYGYADKLDRAYLPPANAASSGGSPGSLIAPGIQAEAFGQGLPISGRQPGLNGFGKPISSQNGLVGSIQNSPGTAYGSTFNPSGVENGRVTSGGNGYGASNRISATGGFNNAAPSATSKGFRDSNQNLLSSSGQSKPGSFNQGLGQDLQGFNGIAREYNQERPQAAAERNAETLKYTNENNGESYSYSFETSNGISAEESGVATNGVVAQGGYSYTGDDGIAYSVSYTADENGYLPQGEHLPTPHPIPEEILKSIEENAKAAAAGTQEGAYNPEEYESELSQQYNTGSGASYQSNSNQKQSKGPAYNPTQTNQYRANQGIKEQNLIGQANQNSPVNQQYNKDTVSGQGFGQPPQGQIQQNNQDIIQKSSQNYNPRPSQSRPQSIVGGQFSNQSPNHGFPTQNSGQLTQSKENGYQYNQPQNVLQPSSFTQGAVNQYKPQAGSQGQNTFSSGPSDSGSIFKGSQGNFKTSFGNRHSIDQYQSPQPQSQIGSGELSISANRQTDRSFPKQSQDNQNNQPFGFQQGKPADQGYQYQAKQPSLGFNEPSVSKNSGSQNEGISNQPSFGFNNKQKSQSSVYESGKQPPFGSSSGLGQNEKLLNTIQNGAAESNQVVQSPQFPQNANQQLFNYNQTPNKISQYQQSGNQASFGNRQPVQGSQFPSGGQRFGTNTLGQGPAADLTRPAQAPYQYNKPSQSFTTQPPKFLPLDSQPSKVKPGQGNQDRSEVFSGPRQPPSFSSQEGYKY